MARKLTVSDSRPSPISIRAPENIRPKQAANTKKTQEI